MFNRMTNSKRVAKADKALSAKALNKAKKLYLDVFEDLQPKLIKNQLSSDDLDLLLSSSKNLGDIATSQDDHEAASKYYEVTMRLFSQMSMPEVDEPLSGSLTTASYLSLGDDAMDLNNDQGAFDNYSLALVEAAKLHEASPECMDAQQILSVCFEKMGNLFFKRVEAEKAITMYNECLKMKLQLVSQDSGNVALKKELANTYESLSKAEQVSGRFDDAKAHWDESQRIRVGLGLN